MTITFQAETFDQLFPDIQPLLSQHWAEVALYQDAIPLDPDFTGYKRACDAGVIRLYTARLDGKLIGYAPFVVVPRHLHYNHRWAKDDIVWIHPDHRNFGVGNGLFDFFEADLRRDGPIVVQVETKALHPALALLCKARGYDEVGPSFSRRLG